MGMSLSLWRFSNSRE
jgi:hypothetical protein